MLHYDMKYFYWFNLLFLSSLVAENSYIDQIQVVDRCTHIVEPMTVVSLGIKGALYEDFEAAKAVRACEKSIDMHPNDSHIKFLLARAYSKAGRYSEGFQLTQNACRDGDIGGCTLLGGYYDKGLHGSYDAKRSYLLWLWSCYRGDSQACHNLAMLIDNKRHFVPKDSKNKKAYLLEACMGGDYPQACTVYANHMYFKRIKHDKEIHEYTNYQACISGHNNSCIELDRLLKENKDPLRKQKLYYSMNTSCHSGNAKACERLGSIYGKKSKTKLNNLIATTYYEKGCNSGAERFSCWYAGLHRIAGSDGVVKDIPLGIRYIEKACYVGMNSFACYDLAKFYLYTQERGYQNREKAVRPLQRACKIGNVRSLYLGCDQHIEICCQEKKRYENKK